MDEDQIRAIVRDEIAKMIEESGIIPGLIDLVSDALTDTSLYGLFGGIGDLFRPGD